MSNIFEQLQHIRWCQGMLFLQECFFALMVVVFKEMYVDLPLFYCVLLIGMSYLVTQYTNLAALEDSIPLPHGGFLMFPFAKRVSLPKSHSKVTDLD
jgi:hypothetical protein